MGQRSIQRPEAEKEPLGGPLEPRPPFAHVYESQFAFVWRMARRLGTPEASLDDVVQEIFIVAYRRQAEFEGRSSLRTWLYGIVLNVVRAHRRLLGAKHPHALYAEQRADPDLLADGSDGPHERAAKKEAARFIDRFLDGLDDDRREVFVLAELEQLSAPEIAALLGVRLNTVYSRLRLGRLDFAKAVARHRARDRGRSP